MFEELNRHRAAVSENIQKGFEIGFTAEEDAISKAHKEGDIHPNGKWVWTRLPSGKYDWRVIKNQQAHQPSGGSASSGAVKSWDKLSDFYKNGSDERKLWNEWNMFQRTGDPMRMSNMASILEKKFPAIAQWKQTAPNTGKSVLTAIDGDGNEVASIDLSGKTVDLPALQTFMDKCSAIKEKKQSKFTRQELRDDYSKAEWADNAEKKALGAKYGLTSLKKVDIQKAILLQLREVRKTATSFDVEDVRDFFRLEPGILKIKDWLKDEGIGFVKYLKEHELEYLKKHKIDKWIGWPIGNNNYQLSYSDKDALKRYAKITEYLEEATPRPRTAKDDAFDGLVRKFTDLLANYKEEYLGRVKDYARQRYNVTLPGRLQEYREKYKELQEEGKRLDWRTDKDEYEENRKARVKLSNKIDAIEKFFNKYKKLTDYVADCEKIAKEEFEDNIKTLSDRIMREELNTDKLVVKSVHDDPKVFNMKITDGTKNLYCRSILAAMYSAYMIPHYRFIITNRKDG